jgi:hypothetical protein
MCAWLAVIRHDGTALSAGETKKVSLTTLKSETFYSNINCYTNAVI